MDFEGFRSNPMAVAAVERKIQIVSEAAIRLGEEADKRCPDQPWRDIRGIGNQLRHAYERVDLNTIWNAVTEDVARGPFGMDLGLLSHHPYAESAHVGTARAEFKDGFLEVTVPLLEQQTPRGQKQAGISDG